MRSKLDTIRLTLFVSLIGGIETLSEIRLLQEEDYPAAARLSDFVFDSEEMTSMKQAFPKVFSPALRQCYGAFENHQLVAFVGLVPSLLRIGGARLQVYSLGSVCTHPDYRGKGYASDILEKVQTHLQKSGASLLFVSGNRSLYRKMGCFSFGTFARFTIDDSTSDHWMGKQSSISVRQQRATDWFRLKKLADRRPVAFEQSIWDLADLIHAEGFASRDQLTHRVLIAERESGSVGYIVIGIPDGLKTQSSIAVEWGGEPDAVARLFAEAVYKYGLSSLEVPVPFTDTALQDRLRFAKSLTDKNNGTVCIIDPEAFIDQLRPYLKERNAELNQSFHVQTTDQGDVALKLQEKSTILRQEAFVSLVFDREADVDGKDEVCQMLRRSFFPMPCPYLGSLNYV